MKTKNNVQKANFKLMAVVFSFILISMTINAQNLWKSILENASFNEIALAMTESTAEANLASTDANASAAYFEIETEKTLELEDWMVNEFIFSTNNMYMEVETEEALELENWMINGNNFENSSFQVIEEYETGLKLEDWILKNDFFNTNENLEQPLGLEKWMTSAEIWIN